MAAPDPQLQRTKRQFDATGLRILLVGGILAAIGAVMAWVLDLGSLGAGIMWLAVVPTGLGLALILIGGVSGRASHKRPFA